jgi:hypothetical protein
MPKSDSIFLKCQCGGCSLLEVNYDDFYDDNERWQFNVAMWVSHPGTRPMSKKERIRWCAEVMKTGKPWADHTILSKEDALRLAKFILKNIEPPKQNGKTKR